jgi:hypothetical protein
VVDLEDVILKSKNLIGSNQNEEVGFAHMLSLLALPTKRRQGNKPLMDYSNSHVVTLNQYLVILKQKVVDKKIANKLKEQKVKERGKKGLERLKVHISPRLNK